MMRIFLFFLKFLKNIYLFLRDRKHEWVKGRGKGGQKIWNRLCTDSREPNVGLELINHKIMTWAKVRCSTDRATQAPWMMRIFNALAYNSELKYTGIFKLPLSFQELTQEFRGMWRKKSGLFTSFGWTKLRLKVRQQTNKVLLSTLLTFEHLYSTAKASWVSKILGDSLPCMHVFSTLSGDLIHVCHILGGYPNGLL